MCELTQQIADAFGVPPDLQLLTFLGAAGAGRKGVGAVGDSQLVPDMAPLDPVYRAVRVIARATTSPIRF